MTCIWRDITKMNSNVNFVKSKNTPLKAFAYVAKYISKGGKYAYLGKFRLEKI